MKRKIDTKNMNANKILLNKKRNFKRKQKLKRAVFSVEQPQNKENL
jgi:hypothetical protein